MKWHNKLILIFCLYLANILALPQRVEAFGEGVAVYRSGSFSVPDSTWVAIPWNNEIRDDTQQFHAAEGTALYVPEGYEGWYVIESWVGWSVAPAFQYCRIWRNSSQTLSFRMAISSQYNCDLTAVYYLLEDDIIEFYVFQSSGGNLNLIEGAFRMVRIGPEMSNFNQHRLSHQASGYDEIDVTGLSGILTDTQDAGWLQGLSITSTIPNDGQVLAWDALAGEWQPQEISATGGFTMLDVITATISGTVPVIITNTWHYTEVLSSGHDIAIIRSFTYGEASIVIGLFVVAAMMGIQLLFALQRR